jgi:hypothetical protein
MWIIVFLMVPYQMIKALNSNPNHFRSPVRNAAGTAGMPILYLDSRVYIEGRGIALKRPISASCLISSVIMTLNSTI